MLQAQKNAQPDKLIVNLTGTIDEADDFSKLIGDGHTNLEIHCQGVTKINSVGVKNWIRYFNSLQKTGATVCFFGFPPALVDQINMIQNFSCGGTIASVMLPFRCGGCKASELVESDASVLKNTNLQIPASKCPKCNSEMEFDDIAEDYLAFLTR